MLAKDLGPNVKVGTPRVKPSAFGDVVMLAVPYGATPQVGRDYAAELKGKVVLDAGNPYPSRDGDMAVRDRQRGTGVASAWKSAGVRDWCARSTPSIQGPSKRDAFRKPERLGIPLAADDAGSNEDRSSNSFAMPASTRCRSENFPAHVEFDFGTPVYVRGATAAELRQKLGLK